MKLTQEQEKRLEVTYPPDKSEVVLSDGYPVFGDYFYIFDGIVRRSDAHGTVRDAKRIYQCSEVRSFNLFVPGREKICTGDKIGPFETRAESPAAKGAEA